MADKKITDLPILATADATDILPIVDISGNVTKRTTISGTAAAVASSLPNNSIQASNLATSAITLGYAEITSDTTQATTSRTAVSGLSTTVTVPAGGRKIRVTAYSSAVQVQNSGYYFAVSIWDGAVGTGTMVATAYATIAASNGVGQCVPTAVLTPSAGTKTYNVGMIVQSGAGTSRIKVYSPTTAYLLVEAI